MKRSFWQTTSVDFRIDEWLPEVRFKAISNFEK